jgi:hypothetical protein
LVEVGQEYMFPFSGCPAVAFLVKLKVPSTSLVVVAASEGGEGA